MKRAKGKAEHRCRHNLKVELCGVCQVELFELMEEEEYSQCALCGCDLNEINRSESIGVCKDCVLVVR